MSGGDWKDLYAAACRGDLELVRFHADRGVDLDYAHPEFQSTALVAAIVAGQEDAAHLLLDLGADPLLWSEFDELTPVEAARQAELPALEERLVAAGAHPPAQQDEVARRRRWWPLKARARRGRR
ncbi:ankyrin repeat domain-containing protein [Aeromicrobium phragmitis]|uniref:Ankyrin repeat domain-containing protein n=1 Tax=Aeromicrobium phragmitis TaxID=2478914 RepID=A0A3L8PN60_9ACTN|nr:ankyrin repeat domain-containing protein [Aeromicrobium phragmitis]RLV56761.1 ankyrin repeat domain-containing protein [Aeromicrobium phragmitis]